MKITTLAIFLLLCFACKDKYVTTSKKTGQSANNYLLKSEFQTILNAFDVKGSILIYDVNQNNYYSNNFEWSKKGYLPASTFKIPNTIIGLETGVISGDSTIFKWDGKKKPLKSWEQDLDLKEAFQFSCVPCYQDVARKIGHRRMNEYVQKLNYGNLQIDSLTITDFWLEGASRISQMQQIDFLMRLYNAELPISERTLHIIKNIMLIEETDASKLSGKSGLSNVNGSYNGWFVGYLEVTNKMYLFATNLEPKDDFDFDSFVRKRKEVTLLAFKEMNLLD